VSLLEWTIIRISRIPTAWRTSLLKLFKCVKKGRAFSLIGAGRILPSHLCHEPVTRAAGLRLLRASHLFTTQNHTVVLAVLRKDHDEAATW